MILLMQAEVRAEEERDSILDLKIDSFRQRHQQTHARLVFYSWTLLAANRVTDHIAAYSLLEKVKLRDQASLNCKALGHIRMESMIKRRAHALKCVPFGSKEDIRLNLPPYKYDCSCCAYLDMS